jgi:hypothetical protein
MTDTKSINTIVNLTNKHNNNVYLPLYIPDVEEEKELEERKKQGKVRKSEVDTETETETGTEQNSNMDYYENEWEDVKNKNNCKLHFGENSWQYKMINDLYIFKDDGSAVLDVFDLTRLNRKFNKARNNYYRNKYIKKMMKTITEKSWESIKDIVVEKYKIKN